MADDGKRNRDAKSHPRGIFERPQGSGVWWAVYFDENGKRHREKVGPKGLAKQVYEIAGLGPEDLDAAVIYDAFSPIVLWQLESFGLCGPGEAKDFVKDGNLELGGRLPSNTHGGQLSEAYIHGMNGVNEGVRLIRGTSHNQPDKNDHVLVTAGVGIPTSGMILGKLS